MPEGNLWFYNRPVKSFSPRPTTGRAFWTVRSSVRAFIRSVRSFFCSYIHSFLTSSIRPSVLSFFRSFVRVHSFAFILSFVRSYIGPLARRSFPSVLLFVRSFTHPSCCEDRTHAPEFHPVHQTGTRHCDIRSQNWCEYRRLYHQHICFRWFSSWWRHSII